MESQHVRIETDTKSRYEGILAEKLQELRELYDTEAKQYRDETDNLYSSKVLLQCDVTLSTHVQLFISYRIIVTAIKAIVYLCRSMRQSIDALWFTIQKFVLP